MKYISNIMRSYYIHSNNLLPFSISQFKPKLCIDCKFYKNNFFTNSKFGKCSLFLKDEHDDYFLVNGKNNIEYYQYSGYYYCSTSRKYDNMCGNEGKFYEEK